MEVRLFGELEAVAAGVPVPVRGAKQRALLALLALQPGQPVSADRLIDALWGDGQAANPANALQAQIGQLRRTLGPAAIPPTEAGSVPAPGPGRAGTPAPHPGPGPVARPRQPGSGSGGRPAEGGRRPRRFSAGPLARDEVVGPEVAAGSGAASAAERAAGPRDRVDVDARLRTRRLWQDDAAHPG